MRYMVLDGANSLLNDVALDSGMNQGRYEILELLTYGA